MYWNNRVTRRAVETTSGVEHVYEIREVHYGDDGTILGWTAEAVGPFGETLDEIRAGHELIGQAFSHPVIDITDEENPVELSVA